MNQSTLKIIGIAMVILFLVITPTLAELQTINPGATVFIGEGDLNITRAIDNSTLIAWWSSGTNIKASVPAKVLVIGEYATRFGIRSSEFTGYTGNWYQYDTTTPDMAGPLTFTVADPMLEIQIVYADNGTEVSGNPAISGSPLSFRILTNQYAVMDPGQRPNVDPATDGYITVKVIDDTGTRYTELYDNSALVHPLGNLTVDGADWFWGGTGHYVWNTDSMGDLNMRRYPYGTYSVSAKSDLNGLRNNYKNAGEDYTGKTVTSTKLAIINSPNPEILEEKGISVVEQAAQKNAAMIANMTQRPLDIVQPMPTSIPDRAARSMKSDKSESVSVANNITELLVYWNENLHWDLSPAQIDEYTLSMENGVLKKYMTNPDYPHALIIPDEHQFNREVGDELGFTQSESEDFVRALDELEINQFRKSNRPSWERTASALLDNLPQWGTTLTKPESQSAPYAYGKVDYIYIFVNFDFKNPFPPGSQADWSQADINDVLGKLETATVSQITEVAPTQASVSNTGAYYVTRVDGQNTGDNAAAWGPGGWMEGALYNLGFRDGTYGDPNQIIRDDFVKYQKASSNSDAVLIVFLTHDNVGGFATNPNDPVELGYADRAAVPYWKKDHLPFDLNPPSVYTHEIVHMFGALDEYAGGSDCHAQSLIAVSPMREMYTNENHHNCVVHSDDTLMNNPYTYSYLSSSTRNFIGWGNNDGDSDIDLIDPNPWGTTYTVTSGNTAGGTIDPKGSYAVPKQGSKSYSISNDPGYSLTYVTVDGVPQGASSSFTLNNVLAAHTVTAHFSDAPIPIFSTVGTHGSVVPEYPTIYVTPGESQQFSYFPDLGYVIDDVVVDSVSKGPIQKYDFINTQKTHTISATFKPYSSTYTITPSCGSDGMIDPSTVVTVPSGGNQTFAVTANASYEIDTILVNTVTQPITNKTSMIVTISNVQSNSQISATFKPAPLSYTVVPSWGTGGTINPFTPVTVPVGGSQDFTISADTTHEIDTILVNTVPQTITNRRSMTVTVSNVQSNSQISVTFKTTPPAPLASFTATPLTGPAPLTVTFTNLTSPPPDSGWWDFGDNSSENATEPNPVHTYLLPGLYNVSLNVTNSYGISNTTTIANYINVTAPPAPIADFTATPLSGIAPLTVTFTNLTSPPPINETWDFGDNSSENATEPNPVHTYLLPGLYNVSLNVTNSYGISNTTTIENYINVTAPTASFTATPTSGLVPLTVAFTDTSTLNATSWSWDFGDGDATNATLQNPVHTYKTIGKFTVSLTASNNNWNDTTTRTGFIWVPAIEYPYGNASAWKTYLNNTPDRAFDGNPATSWIGYPNSWIIMDYGPGVSHVINQYNMVPSLGGPNTVHIDASTDNIYWTNLYTQSNIQWIGENQIFSFTNNRSYEFYRLWISTTGGAKHGFSELDMFYNGSTLPPDITTTTTSGIAPLTVTFTGNSSSLADTWTWDFGDGNSTNATVQNPVHTYWRSGSYSVTLTVSNATTGTSTVTKPDYIAVSTISRTISPWTSVSGPYTIVIFNGTGATTWTAPQDVDTVDYLVVGGGGGGGGTLSGGGGGAGGLLTGSGYPVNQSIIYTVSVGSGGSGGGVVPQYDIGQTGRNGGNSSFDSIITVGGGGGGVQIGTTIGQNGGSGGGGSNGAPGGTGIPGQGYNGGLGFGIPSISTGGGGGAGSSGSDGISTAGGAGGNGLSSNITGTQIFYAGGGGGAAYLRTASGTGGIGGGGTGAGAARAVNGTNDLGGGGGGGSYDGISYLAGADGGSGVVVIRYLTQPITADFTANITVGQFPLAVQFTDSSFGSPDVWNWSFGDGNTTNATVQSPVHIYWSPGAYNVSLSVANSTMGYSNTTTRTSYINVTTILPPVANFTASPTSGLMPLYVQFNDTSNGNPTNWSWNFGDGGTSTIQNPLHTYNASGNYTVNFTALNAGGPGTLIRTGLITVTPSIVPAVLSITPATGSKTTSISITNLSGTNFTAGATVMLTPVNSNPLHKGSINSNAAALRHPLGVYVFGNYAYVASAGSNALEIVDVTNPASPVHKSYLTNGAGGAALSVPTSVYVSGNYAYVASGGSYALEIVNVTNPASPVHAGRILDGAGGALLAYPTSVYVSGNYAYVASSGSNALEIVDVTNPANPVHKGSIVNGTGGALLAYPISVYVSGNYAYVASSNSNALEIVDVSNPASPVHKGSIANGTGGALLKTPNSVYVSGNYAYVASGSSNALEIVDISSPASPVHKGSIIHGTGGALLNNPSSVYTSGNLAYVASLSSNALEIVDVTNPASPVHKASVVNGAGGAILSYPTTVYVSGTYAYVVGGSTTSGALEIVNIGTVSASNVTVVSPTKITGTFNLPGTVAGLYNVVVTNPYGHTASLANGFTVTA